MDLNDLPKFTVTSLDLDGRGQSRVTGTFSHLRGVRNERGCLYRAGGASLISDLDHVPTASGEPVSLHIYGEDGGLRVGDVLPWVDGYWDAYHVDVILRDDGWWAPAKFTAEAAHYFRQNGVVGWCPEGGSIPEGAEDLGVRAGAWDHEHCFICFDRVGADGAPRGYVAPDERWLCEPCHDRYAAPHDLAFILE